MTITTNDHALRPPTFDEYHGQDRVRDNLRLAVQAAKQRGEPVSHILLHGPPGLGKTTLAYIIAHESGAKAHVTSAPAISKASDLLNALLRLGRGDVLFIDEIHRLPASLEEAIYPAMEDFKSSYMDGQRSLTFELQPFTLIGATTRIGLITAPMRSRFGITEHLKFYSPESLAGILTRSAGKLGVTAEPAALDQLARRSRGTPRIANHLLRRARDLAQVAGSSVITLDTARQSLHRGGIDELGLDDVDRKFIVNLIRVYNGGPVGIDAIAATIAEDRFTLEDVVEPYLLQTGLVSRTRKGRMATALAYKHMGIAQPRLQGAA